MFFKKKTKKINFIVATTPVVTQNAEAYDLQVAIGDINFVRDYNNSKRK